MELPNDRYGVILADPPWLYSGSPDKWAAAGKHYKLMPPEEINALPIMNLMQKPAVVFLWATGPKLDVALDALRAWGLHYRGVAFVWVKTKKDGSPMGAAGVRPSVIKPLTEFVLVGAQKAKGKPMPIASEAVVQTIFAPRQDHSRKPVEVFERIEQLYPNATKLEMFGRGKAREGWSIWGDESE